MDVNFKHTDPTPAEPIRIEQVFAEKPGGGLVSNPEKDLPPTTPVKWNDSDERYEAISESDSDSVPEYVTGNWVYAGQGDQLVRLINGANLRKETAVITKEQAAKLPTIKLV